MVVSPSLLPTDQWYGRCLSGPVLAIHIGRPEITRALPMSNQKQSESCLKGANRGRRGPRKGPKRGPRRARGGPDGLQDDPRASVPALDRSPARFPSKTGPVLGCSGVRFGAQVGSQIVQNWPRSASKKGVKICMPKNTPGEPESELQEVSGRPPARLKSSNPYVFYDVFEVSSLCA